MGGGGGGGGHTHFSASLSHVTIDHGHLGRTGGRGGGAI